MAKAIGVDVEVVKAIASTPAAQKDFAFVDEAIAWVRADGDQGWEEALREMPTRRDGYRRWHEEVRAGTGWARAAFLEAGRPGQAHSAMASMLGSFRNMVTRGRSGSRASQWQRRFVGKSSLALPPSLFFLADVPRPSRHRDASAAKRCPA